MGLYSVAQHEQRCPRCEAHVRFDAQFKYGNLYAHTYRVGDRIVWGRTQVGDPSERRVAVSGIGVCAACGSELDFDVIIADGALESVHDRDGSYDYRDAAEGYLVIAR